MGALQELGIEPVAPQELFSHSQWRPAGEGDGPQLADALLAAWAPFGAVAAVLRMALWVGGIALDAPWFRQPSVVGAWMALLGVRVVWSGEQNVPRERHVLVSNHVSVGDLLVLFQRPQRYVHLITNALPQAVYGTRNLPAMLQPANKAVYLQLQEPSEQQQQQQQQQQEHGQAGEQQHTLRLPVLDSAAGGSDGSSRPGHAASARADAGLAPQHAQHQQHARHAPPAAQPAQQAHGGVHAPGGGAGHAAAAQLAASQPVRERDARPSVHLFPEGGMTNGRGMMRFSRGFMLFADKLPVVPVALRVRPAFPQLASHTMDSSFLANLFWFSFQPWTVIEARALPAMRLGDVPGEGKAAFVQRVQLAIAAELRVWVSDLSIQHKRQLAAGGGGKDRSAGRLL